MKKTKKMRYAIIVLILILSNCSEAVKSDCDSLGKMTVVEIIQNDTDKILGKFSIDLRIIKELTVTELNTNAEIIKCQNPGYDRYFITYYLPNYEVGKGAWATTHFNPQLSINILNLQRDL